MRTIDDWEGAASRIWHVVNDHSKTYWLHQDVLWLGLLDVKIKTAKTDGTAPLELLNEKIMHSKLWVLQAYEIIRALNEFDDYPTKIKIRENGEIDKTGYFTMTKYKLESIRIPLVKYQKVGGKESSYVNIRTSNDSDVIFVIAGGKEISYETISKTVYDSLNNYVRPEKFVI